MKLLVVLVLVLVLVVPMVTMLQQQLQRPLPRKEVPMMLSLQWERVWCHSTTCCYTSLALVITR